MTPEERQDYIQQLLRTNGSNLTDLEQVVFEKSKQAADALTRSAHAMQEAQAQVERIKASRSSLEGQHQAYLDMLFTAEEKRRSTQAATTSDFRVKKEQGETEAA